MLGRSVGVAASYKYSNELKAFGGEWTEDRLIEFITKPMLTVPGTKMRFYDGWTDREVADIIAFLKTQNE